MKHLVSGTVGLSPSAEHVLHPTPEHVAIIMDGNGRWAKSQGKPRLEGHRAGSDNIRRIVEVFARSGVRYLTLFAFSTENWLRPDDEVRSLIQILGEFIKSEVHNLHQQGVRIRHLGRLDRLSPELQEAIRDSVKVTENNTGMTVSGAFNYGGRAEILDAVRRMIADRLSPDEITEEAFGRYLYTNELPDPDLIIRTAGEMRLSNFMLWQSAYAEYYATPAYWPDFDEGEVAKALGAYAERQRRFGKVNSNESR